MRPSDDARSRMSDKCRASWSDPDIRARRIAGIRAAFAEPGLRAQCSRTMTLRMSSEKGRAKVGKGMRAYWANPENKAKRSAKMREVYADPKKREALVAHLSKSRKRKMDRDSGIAVPKWVPPDLVKVFIVFAHKHDEFEAARHCRNLKANAEGATQ